MAVAWLSTALGWHCFFYYNSCTLSFAKVRIGILHMTVCILWRTLAVQWKGFLLDKCLMVGLDPLTWRGNKCSMNTNIYRTQADLLRFIRPSGLLPRLDTRLRADSICPQGCWGGGNCSQVCTVVHCFHGRAGSASSQETERAGKSLFPPVSWEDMVLGNGSVLGISHSTLGVAAAAGCTVGCRQLQAGDFPSPLAIKIISSGSKQKGW